MSASTVAVVLGVLLVAALVALGVQTRRLVRLRASVPARRPTVVTIPEPARRRDTAAQAAGLAVRTVVETASRLREQGVRDTLLSTIDDFTDWALEERTQIARVAAPDGTVTIFFSDIENSTSLNSGIGDEQWVRLLDSHDRLLSTYIEKYRGHVVKNQGDGYMVVFSTPALGVDAALDIQRALSAKRQRSRRLRRTPIRVRIGLHTGRVIEREGDYFGSNVAMAARVASLADGGEILVTEGVAEALAERADLRITQDDVVELKGLPGEHVLYLVEPV